MELKKKTAQVGFRIPDELKQVLERAQDATGLGVSELILLCVQSGIGQVVDEIRRQQAKSAAEFMVLREDLSKIKLIATPEKNVSYAKSPKKRESS